MGSISVGFLRRGVNEKWSDFPFPFPVLTLAGEWRRRRGSAKLTRPRARSEREAGARKALQRDPPVWSLVV